MHVHNHYDDKYYKLKEDYGRVNELYKSLQKDYGNVKRKLDNFQEKERRDRAELGKRKRMQEYD